MMLHMDGFDWVSVYTDLLQAYSVAGNALTFSTSAGRYGGGAFTINFRNETLGRTLPTNPTDLWTGIAINPQSGQNSDLVIFSFVGDNNLEVYITYNYLTSVFKAWQNNSSSPVLLASSAFTFAPNVFHWLEANCVIGASGSVALYLDGVEVFSVSSVNTAFFGSSYWSTMQIGGLGDSFVATYDDWEIHDTTTSFCNARLGDSRIGTREANADAGPNNGTPSSGSSHFAMIDEAQWSSSNSITIANTDGQEELFDMVNLTDSPSTIFCVRTLAIVEKTDGGTLMAEALTVSAGALGVGPSTPALTTWGQIVGLFPTDPNTGIAWTLTNVNASQAGLRIST